jgi:glycosyltransferase involved in cell wall biosynthesis
MKVALVHDYLDTFGGAERVFLEIARLYPDADVFTLLKGNKEIEESLRSHNIKESFLSKLPAFIKKRHKLLLPLIPHAIEDFDLSSYDLVISSSGAWSKNVITKPSTLHICYCHTPARFLWDYTHEYQKELKIGKFLKPIINLLISKIRIWDYTSANRVDYYIANSSVVKSRIKKYYRQESAIIHPNVNTKKFIATQKHSNYGFILTRLERYKHTHDVIEAYKELPDEKLIIAGTGSDEAYLKSLAKGFPNIEFRGRVSDQEAANLYQECKFFIFPSEDDFGITPVEAMSAGKPVLAINKGGVLDTVIPGETGIFFNKATKSDIKKSIIAFSSHQEFQAEKISTHAQKFSEENFIIKFKAQIDKICYNNKR